MRSIAALWIAGHVGHRASPVRKALGMCCRSHTGKAGATQSQRPPCFVGIPNPQREQGLRFSPLRRPEADRFPLMKTTGIVDGLLNGSARAESHHQDHRTDVCDKAATQLRTLPRLAVDLCLFCSSLPVDEGYTSTLDTSSTTSTRPTSSVISTPTAQAVSRRR